LFDQSKIFVQTKYHSNIEKNFIFEWSNTGTGIGFFMKATGTGSFSIIVPAPVISLSCLSTGTG